MIDILPNRVFRPLHSNDILILLMALHNQPVHSIAALILITLDKVPAQNEMLGNIIDTVTHQTHGNIVPRHAAVLGFTDLVALPVCHALEVHDAVVVEFLAWEDIVFQAGGVDICQWVLAGIPATEAEINAADECESIVDDDELFVVGL